MTFISVEVIATVGFSASTSIVLVKSFSSKPYVAKNGDTLVVVIGA